MGNVFLENVAQRKNAVSKHSKRVEEIAAMRSCFRIFLQSLFICLASHAVQQLGFRRYFVFICSGTTYNGTYSAAWNKLLYILGSFNSILKRKSRRHGPWICLMLSIYWYLSWIWWEKKEENSEELVKCFHSFHLSKTCKVCYSQETSSVLLFLVIIFWRSNF